MAIRSDLARDLERKTGGCLSLTAETSHKSARAPKTVSTCSEDARLPARAPERHMSQG
jgi:hypothetical protein